MLCSVHMYWVTQYTLLLSYYSWQAGPFWRGLWWEHRHLRKKTANSVTWEEVLWRNSRRVTIGNVCIRLIFYPSTQFNVHNLLNVHAKDAGSYPRALLDILFTKEEQMEKCVLCTPLNMDKPLLDKEHVHLFGKYRHTENCVFMLPCCLSFPR